ncbi:MAG: hypothetical protein R2932_16915 [Caldilineaceae bacterium]
MGANPLVVDPQHQRWNWAKALIADLSVSRSASGAASRLHWALMMKSAKLLSGLTFIRIFGHHMQTIRNLHGHPYEFYQKCGFVIFVARRQWVRQTRYHQRQNRAAALRWDRNLYPRL